MLSGEKMLRSFAARMSKRGDFMGSDRPVIDEHYNGHIGPVETVNAENQINPDATASDQPDTSAA